MTWDNKFVTLINVIFNVKMLNLKHFSLNKLNLSQQGWNPNAIWVFKRVTIKVLINLSSKMIGLWKFLKHVIAFKGVIDKVISYF